MSADSLRSNEELIQVMDIWMTCPSLDPNETSVINWVKAELTSGAIPWAEIKHLIGISFWPIIKSAIDKARAAGMLREWPKG